MIFRTAAALIFTLVGGLTGWSLAERLRERRRVCAAIGRLFQRICSMVGRKDEVFAICRDLRADDSLRMLGFLQKLPESYTAGENFRESWKNAVKSAKNIDEDELELLLRLGEILGRSSAEEQLAAIGELQDELRKIDGQHRENLLKRGRLYRAAGLLFGVMAGILVL